MAERFLDALQGADAAGLQALGRRRRLRAGERLFHEHDDGTEVLVLLAGRVKVTRVTDGGREALLAVHGPGELLGEMASLDGGVRSATATALEPVEVLAVAASAFRAYVERTPSAAVAIARQLSRRLRDADDKRAEHVAGDTVSRVCARLVELADRFGEVPITQEELAGWTGSSREAVVKALRTLRELGWIATGRQGITVLDRDALRRRAV